MVASSGNKPGVTGSEQKGRLANVTSSSCLLNPSTRLVCKDELAWMRSSWGEPHEEGVAEGEGEKSPPPSKEVSNAALLKESVKLTVMPFCIRKDYVYDMSLKTESKL